MPKYAIVSLVRVIYKSSYVQGMCWVEIVDSDDEILEHITGWGATLVDVLENILGKQAEILECEELSYRAFMGSCGLNEVVKYRVSIS